MSKDRWNPHDHRDELQVLFRKYVYHPEHGLLCYWHVEPNGQFIFPLQFKEGEAGKWIQSGTIGEIQESTSCLEIGFRTEVFRPRDPYDWEEAIADKPVDPAARIKQLETALREAIELIRDCVPEFHAQGMGCGIEDREITDRYAAAQHGWEKAVERVEEHFGDAADEFEAALMVPVQTVEPIDRTPQIEANLREAYQRIQELEAGLVLFGRHLHDCDQERKAGPIGCTCGLTKMQAPIEIEMPMSGLFFPTDDGGACDHRKFLARIQVGMDMNARVPRDPLQRWTYNANGVYCPGCGPEDIREEIGPLRERRGELPTHCSRCAGECKHPEKGDRGAECNRTVCENKKANWFNHSTRAWYCTDCARQLNEYRPEDAQRLYGHALCTFGSGGARE